jgi:hypothetical protein
MQVVRRTVVLRAMRNGRTPGALVMPLPFGLLGRVLMINDCYCDRIMD